MFNYKVNTTMSRKKKQKQEPILEAEYIATFCNEKRIRNRWAVYISPETHKLLQKTVFTFMDYHVTAMSMVDAILSHHFETHRELISRLHEEKVEKTLNFRRRDDKEDDFGDDETVCP
jgi:hypothetical protein